MSVTLTLSLLNVFFLIGKNNNKKISRAPAVRPSVRPAVSFMSALIFSLEGTAFYAGQLLAPVKGFGL